MEKINTNSMVTNADDLLAHKINEIIDVFDIVFESLRRKEDRLKTLEEDNALQNKMIKFIMRNTFREKMGEFSILPISLQDLYDEENGLECSCGNGVDCICNKPTVKEEYIESLKRDTSKIPALNSIRPTVKECGLFIPSCIYCKKTDGTLCRVLAPGEYWQHWDIKKQIGCPENKNNTSPNGEPTVKEWKCNKCGTVFDISSVDEKITSAKCSCKPTDNSEKIEKIIDEFKEKFAGLRYFLNNSETNITFLDEIESWLRDKLKDICK